MPQTLVLSQEMICALTSSTLCLSYLLHHLRYATAHQAAFVPNKTRYPFRYRRPNPSRALSSPLSLAVIGCLFEHPETDSPVTQPRFFPCQAPDRLFIPFLVIWLAGHWLRIANALLGASALCSVALTISSRRLSLISELGFQDRSDIKQGIIS